MSKISITPSAAGTGVFTISSPATNTDRTLTLPDEAGTVLTSASSLASANLTGTVTVSGSNVGIGTTSPDAKLNIVGATGNQLRLSTSETEHYAIGRNDSTGHLDFYASQPSYTGYTFGGVDGERMRIDSSGNVGIGSTPNAWSTNLTTRALEVGSVTSINEVAGQYSSFSSNHYYAQDGTQKYITSNPATRYYQQNGEHVFMGAGSGTAGNTVPFSEKMRIDSSGRVGIGTASLSYKMTINTPDENHLRLENGAELGIVRLMDDGAFNIWVHGDNSTDVITFTNGSGTGTERMRIDSSGNVGIGVTPSAWWSSAKTLQVAGSTGFLGFSGVNGAIVTNAYYGGEGSNYRYLSTATAWLYEQSGGHKWSIAPSGTAGTAFTFTQAMTLDSSGNLLVGTTSNPAKLTVSGAGGTNVWVQNNINAGTGAIVSLGFSNANGLIGYVQTSGSTTSYITSSDYRLKTDAQPMTGASARVQALKPVNFEWISTGERVDGFLAHEAQTVVPEAVTGTKDAMRDEQYEVTAAVLDADGMVVTEAVMGTRSVPDMQGIDQSKLVPLLTAALQEALNKIEAMETRLAALEAV